VLVARVASKEAETPVGAELASQIFGQPLALRVGSFFVLGLAVIPGLPGLPFLVIGALMFAASRPRLKSLRGEQERLQPSGSGTLESICAQDRNEYGSGDELS
jgi:type III secretory pathway component EscV